jgi:hypothetical protein
VALITESADSPANPSLIDELTEFSTQPEMDSYGGRISGWLYVPLTGDYTFLLSTDNQGELWLSTNEEPENVQLVVSEPSWGAYNNFSRKSEPVALIGGNKYYIMALWKEDDQGDHCQVAWQGAGVPARQIIQGNHLSPYEPVTAFRPSPNHGSTGVKNNTVLRWRAGKNAASHELYFGTDEDAVRNATTASPEYVDTMQLGSESYDPGKLAWESTYYWRVDEVNNLNPDSPWVGDVWSFTTGDFLSIDDFEDYSTAIPIWENWRDGLGFITVDGATHLGNGSGSEVGDPGTDSYTEEGIVHGGSQSMPYWYNNDKPDKTNYSEAKKTLSFPRDWTEEGVKALSLWFQGYPASVGSFVESPPGTYMMTASGTDITGPSDEFHYAYKTLTGVGSIVAKVESLQDTDPWAKAGVMIRETLDADSVHAMSFVTPGNGVVFEYRPVAGQNSAQVAGQQTGITAPHWVRLERDISGTFSILHSADGTNWESVENDASQNIQMAANVHIGLALTAHNAALTCEAVFSNVTITGNVSGQWMSRDIGIQSNDPEPMYVAVANSTGQPAVVYHDDPSAAQVDTWTEWNIDLKDFAEQDVNLADVNSIALGFGNRNNPQAGGAGKMYFDDFRLYRPRCVPDEVTLSQADLNSDCVVDYRDLEIMVGDWLTDVPGSAADFNGGDVVDFKDYAVLADQWLEEQIWPE